MEYQNKLLSLADNRIHPILQHYQWVESADKPLDFSESSDISPYALPNLFNQLEDAEKQLLYDRLTNLELIFWSLGDDVLDKIITDKNSQALNESYEAIIENRRIAKYEVPDFEKVAA